MVDQGQCRFDDLRDGGWYGWLLVWCVVIELPSFTFTLSIVYITLVERQ